MSTSSIGLLAVFSLPASTTIAWRELVWPMNRSWSDQFSDASIISPLLRIVSRRHQCRRLRDSQFHARLPGTAVPGFLFHRFAAGVQQNCLLTAGCLSSVRDESARGTTPAL